MACRDDVSGRVRRYRAVRRASNDRCWTPFYSDRGHRGGRLCAVFCDVSRTCALFAPSVLVGAFELRRAHHQCKFRDTRLDFAAAGCAEG